jgi:hypothetical protein
MTKADSPDIGDSPAHDGRFETENERLDRNWVELLQELRVIQTGTQILTGFLLTLAFQQRFASLDGYQNVIYLVLVCLAALATVLALTPVSLHRALFRHRGKGLLVSVANRLMQATLAVVGLTLAGTILFVLDVVVGRAAGIVGGAVALVIVATAWLVLPGALRRRLGS